MELGLEVVDHWWWLKHLLLREQRWMVERCVGFLQLMSTLRFGNPWLG